MGESSSNSVANTNKKLTLEQSLLAYRCISTDKSLSWKQNYINEKFSSDNLLKCS